MHSVYQHWDPLRVCAVGRSYPPEFYSWVQVSHVRELFERIAVETEEDFQQIIKKLNEFDVEIIRPELPEFDLLKGRSKLPPPPMCPRDHMIMVGKDFYYNIDQWTEFYNNVRDPDWPDANDIKQLPIWIQHECHELHGWGIRSNDPCWSNIIEYVRRQGNNVNKAPHHVINGAMVSRIGRDLYFSTEDYGQDQSLIENIAKKTFPSYRRHIVRTGGHGDSTYCPVCPGLIISLKDVPAYSETFPGWEVVYLPHQSWSAVKPFLDLKDRNHGKWWIPGFEYDKDVIDFVESWLNNWVGYVEETVFDVNMLIIDPKNVMVFNYNEQVFNALERYGITPHIVPFRHRYFWDGGIHCVTLDLDRKGEMQDFFPDRN